MNEVTRIHLGRQQFVIAVDAHRALQKYLHAIEKRVGNDKEVVKEVELRMAELLTERGIKGDKVVLPDDVAYLREQLGEPSAFGEADTDEVEVVGEQPAGAPRRLFRDTDNAMLAGVNSGLGAYFGIDPLIPRLIFVLLTVTGGAGILIYILLWILVPEAKTKSERLQMRGKAVTVDTLKEVVERADVEGATRRAVSFIEPLFRKLFRILIVIVGVGLLIMAITGLTLLGAFTTHMIANHETLIGGAAAFPVGAAESFFTIAVLTLATSILILTFAAGLSILRRKWVLAPWSTAVIGVIMLIAIAVGGAFAVDAVKGADRRFDSLRHSQTAKVDTFKRLDLRGNETRFVYEPSATYSVETRYFGVKRTIPIEIKVADGTLKVDTSKYTYEDGCTLMCIYDSDGLEVIIKAPRLDDIKVDGYGTRLTIEQLQQDALSLTATSKAYVIVLGVELGKVALNTENERATRTIVISGVRPDGLRHQPSLSLSTERANLYTAAEVEITTPRGCDKEDPLLELWHTPNAVRLNSEQITDIGGLRDKTSFTERTVYNCVLINNYR